ncbi:MAG: hypothetical protein LBH69_00800 [Methanomassiliicoccaceae archaeon]|nr:hypothetical protein [Methanomassiliicoccaceae archaeon]
MLSIEDIKVDISPALKAWAFMFVALFMPGLFSSMVYRAGSDNPLAPLFADANIALALLIFMIVALPVLWYIEKIFAVIPSKNQCYALLFMCLGASYISGYIAGGAPAMAAVLFLSAIGTVTICVLRRFVWYLDDLWIFSILAGK